MARATTLTSMNLSEEQVAECKEAFSLFDKDGDGTISHSELSEMMRAMGMSATAEEIAQMMSAIDRDGNGSIEFAEFLQVMGRSLSEVDSKEEVLQAFAVFDKDGDGTITAVELAEIMQRLGQNLTDKEIREMISEADMNDDGAIDAEEFWRLMTYKS